MPVWGDAFKNPEKAGDQEGDVKAKVQALVEYLKSVQSH